MKHFICSSLLFCILIVPFAFGGDAANAKDDDKKMQGTWKPVSAELGGKPFPDEVTKTIKLVLNDGKYTVTVGDQTDEGTYKLGPTKKPRELDIVGIKGPNQGKTILAIYDLTDSTLRVCYDLSGKVRPKEFKSMADTPQFLVDYKRQKP